MKLVGNVAGGMQVSDVGHGLLVHEDYWIGGKAFLYLSPIVPGRTPFVESTVGIPGRDIGVLDRIENGYYKSILPEVRAPSPPPPPAPEVVFTGKPRVSTADKVSSSRVDAVASRTRSRTPAAVVYHSKGRKRSGGGANGGGMI